MQDALGPLPYILDSPTRTPIDIVRRSTDFHKKETLPSQQPASSSMPPSSMPHRNHRAETLPHGETSIPTTSRPNLENVRAIRERNLHHARAQDLATTRQRNPWSDDDSTLLHGHRFEIHRNQQAHRDKARNLKVDFLLADTEEIKVVARRRNPHRKEDDLDENGTPINTRI
ncbi:hypothetical protein E4U19_003904 [Claviceps sp. Clav32 group G5]|nr:hypothetical protein E4U19_003904 [Claviceps sp. Clav32 group G5]